MIQLREKILVNRPIDQVFAYAGESRHIEEWDTGVISSVKTTPGKTGIGTVYASTA